MNPTATGFIVCVAFLGLGLSIHAEPVDVPRLENIVIDGRLDDWGEQGLKLDPLTPVFMKGDEFGRGRPKKPKDLQASLRIGWTPDGMVLLAEVKDNVWVEHADESLLWQLDGIEFFMAPQRGSRDIAQWVISPGQDVRFPSVRWHFHEQRESEAARKRPHDIVVARVGVGGGCVLEALFPFETVLVDPKPGRELAVQVWVNDADDPSVLDPFHLAWFPALRSFSDSRRMQSVRLAEGPAE